MITGSDSRLLTSFLPENSFGRQAIQGVRPSLLPFHLSRRWARLVCLPRVSVRMHENASRPDPALRLTASRRVLLVVRGVQFRDDSFSASCLRVLCFCSIHSAPSHFASVNSASGAGLRTSPFPLYAEVRVTRFLSGT